MTLLGYNELSCATNCYYWQYGLHLQANFFIEKVYNLEIIILNMTAQRMLWTKRCTIVADTEAMIDIFPFCKRICYILKIMSKYGRCYYS